MLAKDLFMCVLNYHYLPEELVVKKNVVHLLPAHTQCPMQQQLHMIRVITGQ